MCSKNFLLVCGLLPYSFDMSFDEQKFLMLIKYNLKSFLSFVISPFCALFKNTAYSKVMKMISCAFCIRMTFLPFPFRSAILWEFIFVCYLGGVSKYSSPMDIYLNCYGFFFKILSPLHCHLCHKSSDSMCRYVSQVHTCVPVSVCIHIYVNI